MGAADVDYTTFSDQCRRLAEKQASEHDRHTLLNMARAWLLVAEMIRLSHEEKPGSQ
jgi:hypothetical protein